MSEFQIKYDKSIYPCGHVVADKDRKRISHILGFLFHAEYCPTCSNYLHTTQEETVNAEAKAMGAKA